MKLVQPESTIFYPDPFDRDSGIEMMRRTERIGRICYQSDHKITDDSYQGFIGRIMKAEREAALWRAFDAAVKEGLATPDNLLAMAVASLYEPAHESVIEHVTVTAHFVCDRGVSHEIVRHRLVAVTQESTRFCNYGKTGEVTFVRPLFWESGSLEYSLWADAMGTSEKDYLWLLRLGAKPEQARSVLPNSLKTELYLTANLREWRHIFRLRTSKRAHPQMREVMVPLLGRFRSVLPLIYGDIKADKEAA